MHFFIRIQFIRIPRLRFGTNVFRKWGNIRPLQKKSMSNETTNQEKQFKHIFMSTLMSQINGGANNWGHVEK